MYIVPAGGCHLGRNRPPLYSNSPLTSVTLLFIHSLKWVLLVYRLTYSLIFHCFNIQNDLHIICVSSESTGFWLFNRWMIDLHFLECVNLWQKCRLKTEIDNNLKKKKKKSVNNFKTCLVIILIISCIVYFGDLWTNHLHLLKKQVLFHNQKSWGMIASYIWFVVLKMWYILHLVTYIYLCLLQCH